MAAKKTGAKSDGKKAALMSKSALINAVVESVGDISRKSVRSIIEALVDVGYKELKRSGAFTLPGYAKFRVVQKPATKARQGINPFTKQPMQIAAKPKSKSVRARPIKAIKEAVG